MSTSARLALLMVLTVLLGVDVCSAAIVPITSVVAGMNGKPPYTLESITVGDYTITKEFLAIGESTGESILFSDISSADDFDLIAFLRGGFHEGDRRAHHGVVGAGRERFSRRDVSDGAQG